MTYKVRIIWFSSVAGISSRGNRQGFEKAGCEVEEVTQGFQPYHLQQGADFLFTGMIYNALTFSEQGLVKLPIIIQGGGYGPNFLPDGKIDRGYEKITKIPKSLVTVLDPKYYHNLQMSGKSIDFEHIYVVPNGLSEQLTKFPKNIPFKKDDKVFTVFNPMGTFWPKQPEKFIEVVKLVNEEKLPIKFVFPVRMNNVYNCPLEWLSIPNLELLPVQSFSQMMILYQKSDLVVTYSQAEIQPTHFFEALWFGKPVIHNNPALLQTVRVELLEEMVKDFGLDCKTFDEKWKPYYWSGEHFLGGDGMTPKDCATMILKLYSDDIKRKELKNAGFEWAKTWWTMERKCRLLVKMMEERKLI